MKGFTTVVIARCISCKKTREISAGEVEEGDMPLCMDCFSPMVVVRAEARPAPQEKT